MNSETPSIAPQNAVAAAGPRIAPPGSRGLSWRIPSIQVNGRSHWLLVVGPCGPLLKPFSR